MPQPAEIRTKCLELAQDLVNDYYEKSCERAKNQSLVTGDNSSYTAPTDNRKTQVNSVADSLFAWYAGKSDSDVAIQVLESSYELADDIWQKQVSNRIYAHVFPLSTDGSVEDDIVDTRTSYTLPADNRVSDTLEIAEARYTYIQTSKVS